MLRVRMFCCAVVALVMSGAFAGCAEMPTRTGSPLMQPSMSADSVALDIFFIQLPGDESFEEELWSELDEQRLPADVRRRLASNGLRAGVSGWHVPDVLSGILDQRPTDASRLETTIEPTDTTPRVKRRHLQLRAGRRGEVVATGVLDRLPVMIRDEAQQVRGHTYERGQGLFAIRAFPTGDGRARIEMVPEIQHGDPRMKHVVEDAVLRLAPGRPKEVYGELQVETALAPGEMLYLGAIHGRIGSLGHRFFERPDNSGTGSRLLIVRLAQTQHDELFADRETVTPR